MLHVSDIYEIEQLLTDIACCDSPLVSLQPHRMSSSVFLRESQTGSAVIIKRRGCNEAYREKLVFEIARLVFGSLVPISPCTVVPAEKIPGLPASRNKFYTVELLQCVEPGNAQEDGLILPTARRLANQFGCADLGQAYLCTSQGQAKLPRFFPDEPFRCANDWSESDLATILAHLDAASFERLWALHIISMQEDAGAPNLLIRIQEDGTGFELLLTDTCDSFPSDARFDYFSDSSETSSGTSEDSEGSCFSQDIYMDDMLILRGPNYEYPLILELNLCNALPSPQLRQTLCDIDLDKLEQMLKESDAISAEQRLRTLSRVEALQASVMSGQTLREIACEVVAEWGTSWERTRALGHVGPIQAISELGEELCRVEAGKQGAQ
eukprot:TRINITY_DN105857_c0_g1_i1.p1 TRINITY_DN105857_c0_g1~~TRINITY_DN105857_c0_g1_i1.p1  ORF type:complete len:382 (+),score=63.80 TRINITY_DN105857_c0_g1_i1:116-1261(+)